MRASFKLWREGSKVHYVMFNLGDSKTMHDIKEYPMGSHRLNELMTGFLEALNDKDDVLRRNVNDVRFLTTLKGESLICVTYNRPLKDDEDWKFAAEAVRLKLGLDGLIGRSRKVKIVLGEEHIREELTLADGYKVSYLQTEGAFTQPNAKVCQSMLTWAREVTKKGAEEDMCEMYCGNGCFTVALAPNFRRVVATEISRTSVDLAQRNLALNGAKNVQVAAVSAESFSQAYFGNHTLTRLRDVDLTGLTTLLVDPPRAGLDEVCLKLAANFKKILYISCNHLFVDQHHLGCFN
jgi:tRNA (uracil-5-)-methyltransferase